MSNIVIVSNRLPISVRKVDGKLEFYPSAGGLATGLGSITKDKKSRWIGWPGIAADELSEREKHLVVAKMRRHNCYPIFLTKKQLETYYNGYSNSILWPFFHSLPADLSNQEKQWKAYQQVNALFADAVMALTKQKSTIWVHDYQLLLLPNLLRRERPHDAIGFFLHIPFPSSKQFAELKHGTALLLGMLGANLVGFHTTQYARDFLESCTALGVGVVNENEVIAGTRVVRVTDFPIGIDYEKFADASSSLAVQQEVKKLQATYGKRKIILTVDRLDPSKGLVERLQAYQALLDQTPELRSKVVMIMLAVPSRTEVAAYKALKIRLEKLVQSINQTYGTAAWEPVSYLYTSLPFEKLTALYQLADVAFIAPLKDGMNLVAKEYIASQPTQNGVLVLSKTAGAAEELRDAILVNPKKRESLVRGLTRALAMPKDELQKRAVRMQKQISTNTIQEWAGSFMKTLQVAERGYQPSTKSLRGKHLQQLTAAYHSSKKPVLLLDYDGTLHSFVATPDLAKPSAALLALLKKLTAKSTVVLVSGRSQYDLEKWFGKLPLTLIAEHGAKVKLAGKPWKQVVDSATAWKKVIRPALEKYAHLTPGAFVEEKDCSLVWHYRRSPNYYAQKNLTILRGALKPALRTYGLAAHNGNKVLEVKSPAANKGMAIQPWLKSSSSFVLVIGDDYTDEDMFAASGPHVYSVKVGRGKTHARYRLGAVPEVIDLLERLAESKF